MSVMVLQGCKFTPQKSRLIESGHGRHAVQVANAGVKKSISILVRIRLVFAWTVTIFTTFKESGTFVYALYNYVNEILWLPK